MIVMEFGKNILGMSIIASVAIVGVLAIRCIMKRLAIPTVFCYALWGIVLFRLLCPSAIASPFSIFNTSSGNHLFEKRFTDAISENAENSSNENVIYTSVNEDGDKEMSNRTTDEVADKLTNRATYKTEGINNLTYSTDKTPNEYVDKADSETVDKIRAYNRASQVVAIIWIVGVCVMLLAGIFMFICLKKKLVGSVKVRDVIYKNDYINTAFVMPGFPSKIYMPSGLSQDEEKFMLQHERVHLKRKDAVFKILAYLALCLHWFNPLCWVAFYVSENDMEMSCDEAVIRIMSKEERRIYVEMIFRRAQGKSFVAVAPISFGKGNTKMRIKNVLDFSDAPKYKYYVAALMVMVLSVGCGTNGVTKDEGTDSDKSVKEDTQNKEVDLGNSDNTDNSDNTYNSDSKVSLDRTNKRVVTLWGDYLEDNVVSLEEFPDVKFTRKDGVVYANDEVIIGGAGYFCVNCYASDINEDGYPELCFTMSFGSGIVDNRVLILDYKNNEYIKEISDRAFHDYSLELKDDCLYVRETQFTDKEVNTDKADSFDETEQITKTEQITRIEEYIPKM